MEQLLQLDTDIFLFFNGMHNSFADVFFYYFSQMWVWIPLYVLLLWWIIKVYGRKSWLVILMFVLTTVFVDQSCNFIKHSVCRPRPSHTEALEQDIHLVAGPDGNLYYGGAYGFPSAHAANTMALAFSVIFFLSKRKKWIITLAIIWSLLSAYSRIYLGVHYPIDILCGFVLGICWSCLLFFIYKKWLCNLSFRKK